VCQHLSPFDYEPEGGDRGRAKGGGAMKIAQLIFFYAAATLVVAAKPAVAQEWATTQWLYDRCKSPDPAKQESCAAFLMGSASILGMLGNLYSEPPAGVTKETVAPFRLVGICSFDGNGAIVRQVFINWAEKNPTVWKESASNSAMAALQNTWPCKRKD
jgi:hypothetical protein